MGQPKWDNRQNWAWDMGQCRAVSQKMKGQSWSRKPWDTGQNFRLWDICDLIVQITLKFGINIRDSVVTTMGQGTV